MGVSDTYYCHAHSLRGECQGQLVCHSSSTYIACYQPIASSSGFHFSMHSLTDTCNFPLMLQTFESVESERTVTHMFYMTWPDHGVPYNTMSLVSFIRRVRDQHPASSTAPLLVHCSAGVRRTGTFILLDLATQQMRREGTLSVFNSLQSMRNQRMKTVQTLVSV